MKKRSKTTPPPSTVSQNGTTNGTSPADVLYTADPGDETQKRFRYQHSYGVILLTAAARGALPYIAIWCEHHEDLLGERLDGLWDGYQIKTQRPENGEWNLQKEALKDSIKRFVALNERFPGKIYELSFVTNCDFLDSNAQGEMGRSPVKLLNALRDVVSADELLPPFSDAFELLRHHCNCSEASLFAVLKKLRLISGPALTSFDAELTQDHLPHMPECASLSVPALKALRDELVALVYRASSLANDDPSRHWCCIHGDDHLNPALQAKKITITRFGDLIKQRHGIPFRYLPATGYLDLGRATENTTRLYHKMVRGGLVGQFETMRRRALSAEYHLLELAQMKPERFELTLNQLVNVVKGECDDAQLAASLHGEPYGHRMLVEVHRRLKEIADNRPAMVDQQQYECLIGVAGLLSGECQVWWSDPFDLEGAI